MSGLVLYSTNTWYALEVGKTYRGNTFYVWASEYFDSFSQAPQQSSGQLIAPSSCPRKIYEDLFLDVKNEDNHSSLIKSYKKTFKALATRWHNNQEITTDQRDEMYASIKSNSWKMWKPLLFVIPKANIHPNRIKPVPLKNRAAYGPEFLIEDLALSEFDIIDLTGMRL